MEYEHPTLAHKRGLVESAIASYKIKSLLDVGACWGVHGGYTFHALRNGVEKAVIIDGIITDITKERAAAFPNLELRQMSLGDKDRIAELPHSDAVIIFDVLLHQVKPDWDEFLRLYAAKTDTLIIYNQDFIGDKPIRFVDMGEAWFQQYGFTRRREDISAWFAKHDEFCPEQNKKYRDIHNFWQWGIPSMEIIKTALAVGFRLDYFCNHGQQEFNIPIIDCHSFLFRRK